MRQDRGNVFTASLLMVGITLVLFFLPFINGVIGGAVGGYMLGDVKRALIAAILPAVFVSLLLLGIFALFGSPIIGIFAGMTGAALVFFADVGIFIGAVIGGWMGARSSQPRLRV
jgi:hypothetical protein